MKTYKLKTILDLLKVPSEKREECVRQLLYALLVREMAMGDVVVQQADFEWTDDGDKKVILMMNGKPVVGLDIVVPDPNANQ